MGLVLADRCKETTTTTGTGTISLGGAQTGYQTLVSGVGTGNPTDYCIADQSGSNWEVGTGTVTSGAPDTLTRTRVWAGSAGVGTLVNFAAGTKDVFCVARATGRPTVLIKSADENRQSTTTLASDSTLATALLANTAYMFRFTIYFGTPSTGGLKWDLNYTGTNQGTVSARWAIVPGATAFSLIGVDTGLNIVQNTVAAGNGFLSIVGQIATTTAGTFSLRWAQQSSQASATAVYSGSMLEYQTS